MTTSMNNLIEFKVLILRELAVNAPTLFYQKVQPFFDNIFTAIRDPKVSIHAFVQTGGEVIHECLRLLVFVCLFAYLPRGLTKINKDIVAFRLKSILLLITTMFLLTE